MDFRTDPACKTPDVEIVRNKQPTCRLLQLAQIMDSVATTVLDVIVPPSRSCHSLISHAFGLSEPATISAPSWSLAKLRSVRLLSLSLLKTCQPLGVAPAASVSRLPRVRRPRNEAQVEERSLENTDDSRIRVKRGVMIGREAHTMAVPECTVPQISLSESEGTKALGMYERIVRIRPVMTTLAGQSGERWETKETWS